MAKGQKRGNREAKKPKTAAKALRTPAATSFLRPGPVTTGSSAPPAGGGRDTKR